MAAIIPANIRQRIPSLKGAVCFGVDLKDAREEVFVRMVCDGLALGIAFVKAGFEAADNHESAYKLFQLPRIQERANAILEARRTTGVVTLSEVTDMLKRVYAGAHASEEYSAAHNAAFSLARLYGHVTDKSTVEIIRRPSRDPDAPSEQALTSWVDSLPGLPSPGPASPPFGPSEGSQALEGPIDDAPADLLGPGPSPQPVSRETTGPGPPAGGPDGTGNGAPVGPVTGAPHSGGGSGLLGGRGEQKGSPDEPEQVPVKNREKVAIEHPPIATFSQEYPPIEDLF